MLLNLLFGIIDQRGLRWVQLLDRMLLVLLWIQVELPFCILFGVRKVEILELKSLLWRFTLNSFDSINDCIWGIGNGLLHHCGASSKRLRDSKPSCQVPVVWNAFSPQTTLIFTLNSPDDSADHHALTSREAPPIHHYHSPPHPESPPPQRSSAVSAQ